MLNLAADEAIEHELEHRQPKEKTGERKRVVVEARFVTLDTARFLPRISMKMYKRSLACATCKVVSYMGITMWDFIRKRALISIVTVRVVLTFDGARERGRRARASRIRKW